MKIEHLAIWTSDLEKMKDFYVYYFAGKAGNLYHNAGKNFSSYFITFSEGCRLELMHKPEIAALSQSLHAEHKGLMHMAISTGSKESVDAITNALSADGHNITSWPRTTGDGYYESVIKDPEGNIVEITI